MSSFGEIISVILEFVGDVLFEYIILPVLKTIGVAVRWVLCLGNTSFKELYEKPNNAIIGVLVIVIALISYILAKMY